MCDTKEVILTFIVVYIYWEFKVASGEGDSEVLDGMFQGHSITLVAFVFPISMCVNNDLHNEEWNSRKDRFILKWLDFSKKFAQQ